MPIVEPGGRAIPYEIRRNRRAKRLRLVVGPRGVTAVAPVRLPKREIVRFVESSVDWIEARRRDVAERYRRVVPKRVVPGARMLLRGRQLPIELLDDAGRRQDADGWEITAGDPLRIRRPLGAPSSDLEDETRRRLVQWLQEQAAADAGRYVERHAPRLGRRPAGIRIKDHKTLWGSCGVTGVLHFNWRLIGAPPKAFEYVVVHELCHLERRDHSPAFWRRVEELFPDYREQRRWLRAHALALS